MFITFSKGISPKGNAMQEWSSNLLTMMSQYSTLVMKPQGHTLVWWKKVSLFYAMQHWVHWQASLEIKMVHATELSFYLICRKIVHINQLGHRFIYLKNPVKNKLAKTSKLYYHQNMLATKIPFPPSQSLLLSSLLDSSQCPHRADENKFLLVG